MKPFTERLIALSIGTSLSVGLIKIYSLLLPTSDYIPYLRPIVCSEPKVQLSCLRRRSKSGYYSKGSIFPAEIQSYKRVNDANQFTDTHYAEFISSSKSKVLSVGDSYVEALQVNNEDTFHGRINSLAGGRIGEKYISVAFGASGMSFPNYLKYIEYVQNDVPPQDLIVVIPVIKNDFSDAFSKKGSDQYGSFYFTQNGNFSFIPLPAKNSIMSTALQLSGLMRFFFLNLEIHNLAKIFKSNLGTEIRPKMDITQAKLATNIFLRHLNVLRPTAKDRAKTLLILDSDRPYIYGDLKTRDTNFEVAKAYFAELFLQNGYRVIDTEQDFKAFYAQTGRRLEFTIDPHWNKYGHEVVYSLIKAHLPTLTRK